MIRFLKALLVLVAAALPAAAAVPRPAGPSEGSALLLATVWQRTVEGSLGPGYDPVTGTIPMTVANEYSAAEYAALDAATGEARWQRAYPRISPDTAEIDTVAGGRYLIRSWGDPGHRTELWAIDARDGDVAWHLPMSAGQVTLLGATVLVPQGGTLAGVSLADGAVLWRWDAPLDCTVTWTAAGTTFFTAAVLCSGDGFLVTVDARSRTTLWGRPWLADAYGYAIADDLLLTYGENGTRIYDRTGAVRFRSAEAMRCSDPCFLAADGTLVINATWDNQYVLRGVDERSGTLRWTHRTEVDEMVIVGDRIYLTQPAPRPTPGTTVGALDPSTGRIRAAALLHYGSLDAFDAAAGILYLSDPGILDHDTVAVAVRPVDTDAPGLLGGAPAAQWPDPCDLLSAEDLREVAPTVRFRPSPVRRVLADIDTGTAVSCRFLPDPADGPVVTVSVAWCGNQAARALAAIASDQYEGAVRGLGDEAVKVTDESPYGVTTTMLAVRSGPVVATVQMLGGTAEQTLTLAGAVTRRLRPSGG
ncbi:PQQ-like beta-propeller repeat protein [Actinoplanes sp. KI2]|uniref:PQQ-like beta-propeller repeat protein n=1 Tax=Actinoplanes sp. KI2 TaxID=2983315 RepID=UPI0021D60D99|nr:PQQ-like beta-propeller repeat protein [Actinoplanes sp. KI2]MCU7725146.1 PQQ-like beta-propeller repeat protein [Actinoplanes sp. KI2]